MQKENLTNSKIIKYSMSFFGIFTVVSAFVLVICLLVGTYFAEFTKPSQNSVCKEWNAEWTTREISDEELAFLKEKGVKLSNRDIITASARLPEGAQYHTYLLMSIVYSDVWFFVGDESFAKDELRYEFYPESETKFAKTGYSSRRTIPLYDDDEGKYITFIQVADSKENFITDKDIVYGDKYGLLRDYISKNYAAFITNVILLVLSSVFVIIGLIAAIVLRKKFSSLYLAIGIFNLSIWAVTNAFTMESFFDNWHMMHDMLYLSDIVAPLAMILYLDSVQEGRYKKVYFCFEVVYVPLCLIGIVLYIANIYSLHDFFMKIILLVIAQIVCMFVTVVIDIVNKNTKRYRYVLMGFAIGAVFGVIQIVSYMLNGNQLKLPYLSLGAISLLLMCAIETVQELLNTYVERTAAISASKAKSDVLARMSHEIRTPINAILGMNEMILRTTRESESKQYAEDVKRATNNLLEIVNDILDFSKIDSGKMELLCEEYNFANLINDVVKMFSLRADDKGLKFTASIDRELPTVLFGDSVKIRQILANLLSNAVKYTNEGTVEFVVDGRVEDDKASIRFSVKDTGIGILPENMNKLFAEFERIEERRNRGVEGTGLGLSITSRLLQMMDSALEVESVYGEGSEFYFYLEQKIIDAKPIGQFEERQREQLKNSIYESEFVAPQARILVVDDNAMNLKVFINLLKETMIQIDSATSGEECLNMVMQKKYDIIFLDHMMPEMDGVETLHRLKKLSDSKCKDTPVIALTANVVNGAKEFYMAEGFDDFLGKPFKPEEQNQMLIKWLPEEYICSDSSDLSEDLQEDIRVNLPQIEGIDWNCGLSHFRNEETMLETVKEVLQSMSYEADKLKLYYEELSEKPAESEGDFKQYRVQIHSMKSTANLIGAVELGAFAKELEDAAKRCEAELIFKSTTDFLSEWGVYRDRLKAAFEEDSEKINVDADTIIDKLNELKNAFSVMDIDKMDEMMHDISRYSISNDILTDIDGLKALVTDLDDDNGIPFIDRLINKLKTQ